MTGMSSFGRTLNFTSANEDGATELAALTLRPDDHVLCLTASGARPLDLLLGNPARITAIDINPAQNELTRLKIAALRALSDEGVHAYLGIAPCVVPPGDDDAAQIESDEQVERGLRVTGQRD